MPDLPSIFPEGSITWANALISVLILIAAFIVAHFAKKGVNALRTRLPGLHPELISLTARIVKYAIILLAVGIVLALLGANIQPVLAAVIIVAAVGFMAVRGIATNFGAAVLLLPCRWAGRARLLVHTRDDPAAFIAQDVEHAGVAAFVAGLEPPATEAGAGVRHHRWDVEGFAAEGRRGVGDPPSFAVPDHADGDGVGVPEGGEIVGRGGRHGVRFSRMNVRISGV
ncbi:hypothetical protein [Plantibacter sp. YIM 135347]|uniref:hypothetical protein n=1 Tax=Plantibacter sp. YIM 135347 TaxID=3423919 RepID=UPI003D33970F